MLKLHAQERQLDPAKRGVRDRQLADAPRGPTAWRSPPSWAWST